MNMDALKNYATKLLECALELVANKYTSSEVDELDRDLDELDLYMTSLGPYEICVKDAQGNDVICHSIKMQAIYDYHRDHQDLCVDKKVFDSLFFLTRIAKSPYGIYELLEVIEHQIVAESQGRAPFKLDITTLLDNLGKNLEENKALYESDIYEQEGFMAEIRRRSRLLSENHGYTLLCDDQEKRDVTANSSLSEENAISSGVKSHSTPNIIKNEATDPREQATIYPSVPESKPTPPAKEAYIASEEQSQALNNPYDEILHIIAEKKTALAFDFYFSKDNIMALFGLLLGMGGYAVEAHPGAGHCYHVVLQAIYKYSRKHPDQDILGAFETTFKFAAGKIVNISIFNSLTEYLSLQLRYEEDGTSPFTVNIRELIMALKNGLNHPSYKGDRSTSNILMQQFEQYLYQRFGIR